MMNDDLVNRCIAILGTRGPDPTISRDDLDELLSGYQHWHIYGPTAGYGMGFSDQDYNVGTDPAPASSAESLPD